MRRIFYYLNCPPHHENQPHHETTTPQNHNEHFPVFHQDIKMNGHNGDPNKKADHANAGPQAVPGVSVSMLGPNNFVVRGTARQLIEHIRSQANMRGGMENTVVTMVLEIGTVPGPNADESRQSTTAPPAEAASAGPSQHPATGSGNAAHQAPGSQDENEQEEATKEG